ncbi:MAG TPA: hypothetical protein VJP07_07880 [Dehalococcoidia bacterium]|nr:hypothetical protein [Dehalococcoidia bacterium]
MTRLESVQAFRYEIGEEVVVRLERHAAGHPVDTLAWRDLPSWTIAEITSRDAADGTITYGIAFLLDGARLTARILESAIEGIA